MSKTKLGSYFTRANDRKVVTLVEDAPAWLREACYAAHSGALPNDWVYEQCYAACCAIDDGALSDDDDLHMFADSSVDIYTGELAQWYADNFGTDFYSNAEQETADMGTDNGVDVNRTLSAIQYCAIRAIGACILQAWQENAEADNG